MTSATAGGQVDTLEERLTRGADVLFEMERRGEVGRDYERWLRYWTSLLEQYEALQTSWARLAPQR
jgi:hypothetical protein